MADMDEARPVQTARASGSVSRQVNALKLARTNTDDERGSAPGTWGADAMRRLYVISANGHVRHSTCAERRWAGRMAKRRARHV